MKKLIDQAKRNYEKWCNEYIRLFEHKQDMRFEFWVADIVGEIACFGDIFLNLSDIVYDLNTHQKKGNILNWFYESMENQEHSINYYSYTKGLRVNDVINQKAESK